MKSDRIAELFADALERKVEERESYLAAAAADAPEVRAEVAQLLAAHQEAGDFLEAPLDPEQAVALLDGEEAQRIGPYRLIREVGRGGMGTVYEGIDSSLKRIVALKVLSMDLAEDAESVRRFLGEAQAVARLNSSHVVQVFSSGTEKCIHCFVGL